MEFLNILGSHARKSEKKVALRASFLCLEVSRRPGPNSLRRKLPVGGTSNKYRSCSAVYHVEVKKEEELP